MGRLALRLLRCDLLQFWMQVSTAIRIRCLPQPECGVPLHKNPCERQ